MKLFDTHTHLNVEQFKGIEAEVIQAARVADVAYMAIVGFDRKTIEQSLRLSDNYPGLISVVGWHPTEAGSYTNDVEQQLRQWLKHPHVYALGEIGLDYYWDRAPRHIQAEVFKRQINLAKEFDLPIVIHNREATEDVYRILKEEGIPAKGCIMHSFGEGPEWAERFLELGCHISFSGVVTFKKTDKVRDAAKLVPNDRLLIETDAPYLAPVPMRGKRNEPAFVRYVAECLADVRQVSLEELAQLTTQNAFDFFGYYPAEAIHDSSSTK